MAHFDADAMICVDGDDLAFDFNIARRLVNFICEGEADVFEAPKDIICGLITYAFTRDSVKKMYDIVSNPEADTDVISRFIQAAGLKRAEIPLNDEERGLNVRLTLDYPEDVVFFRKIYKIMPIDANSVEIARKAIELGLTKINWHRQKDFNQNQKKFNEQVNL